MSNPPPKTDLSEVPTEELKEELLKRILKNADLSELPMPMLMAAVNKKRLKQANGIAQKVAEFVTFTCKVMEVSEQDMFSALRADRIFKVRQIGIAAMRQLPEFDNATLQDITCAFGRSDHGTAAHAIKTVKNSKQMTAEMNRLVSLWRAFKLGTGETPID